jgi:hypothetical protein
VVPGASMSGVPHISGGCGTEDPLTVFLEH